jgi:hypothetical protein
MLTMTAALAEPTAAAKNARTPAEKKRMASKQGVCEGVGKVDGCWTETSIFRSFYTISLPGHHPG